MPLKEGKIEPEPDVTDKEPPQSEQSKWESDQMSSAVFRFGARDRKGICWIIASTIVHIVYIFLLWLKFNPTILYCVCVCAAQQDYDLLMEDEIEFVQALRMPGHDKDKKREASPPAHVKILQTIQETKKSLPIYPFRNDLIHAVQNYQVSRVDFRMPHDEYCCRI